MAKEGGADMESKELVLSNSNKSILPTTEEFELMQRIVAVAVHSSFLPSEYNNGPERERIAKAMMVSLKGRELGIPVMQSFSHIHIIKGKPTLSAELMMTLIYREHPRAEINFILLTNDCCKIKAKRPGGSFVEFEFSIDDAKRAGLVKDGSGWTKYPRAMLRSRAVSEMARTLFPDALAGCSYTPEELGANVDEEGNIEPQRDVTPMATTKPVYETPKEKKQDPPPPEKADAPSLESSHSHRKENDLDAASTDPGGGTTLENGRHGDYVFPSGKNAGKKMRDIVPEQLRKMVEFAEIDGARPEWGSHFIENATGYLEQLEAEKALSLD